MPVLSLSDRQFLLSLARLTIQSKLGLTSKIISKPESPALMRSAGCFVTLRKNGLLRGCVGSFESSPIWRQVQEMAVAAAFRDPRFPPLQTSELNSLRIEISILGIMIPLLHAGDLVTGKHGIYVKLGKKSGTYLPEVALECGWTGEEFIRHCAIEKAGIASEDFPQMKMWTYEIEKFSG